MSCGTTAAELERVLFKHGLKKRAEGGVYLDELVDAVDAPVAALSSLGSEAATHRHQSATSWACTVSLPTTTHVMYLSM